MLTVSIRAQRVCKIALLMFANSTGVLESTARANDHTPAFKKFLEHRSDSRLFTARFEYSITSYSEPNPTRRFLSMQAAGNRYAVTKLRNEHGVYNLATDGKPAPPWHNQPTATLFTQDHIWQATAGQAHAYVYGPDQRSMVHQPDLRRLGCHPLLIDQDIDDLAAAVGQEPINYSESEDGELILVTGTTGPYTAKWWIDPRRDWNVVRTEIAGASGVTGGMEIDLAFDPRDGIWFPHRVTWTAPERDQPRRVLEIHAVEFNRPEHPTELSPASIGIEVGTQVFPQGTTGLTPGFWDGAAVIDGATLHERVRAGELSIGPGVLRARAQAQAGLTTAPSLAEWDQHHPTTTTPTTRPRPQSPTTRFTLLTAWERYTEAFIQHFHLNTEQDSAARQLCETAQQQARAHLAARRERFTALDARLRELRDMPTDQGPADIRRRFEARQAFAREYHQALEPLREVFNRALTARLDQLPTRAQRAAAGEFDPPDVWAGAVPFAELLANAPARPNNPNEAASPARE